MTRVRYRDLKVEERAIICNGCGSKGGWLNPPDWIFQASCYHHDFNYWLGYREEDRLRADRQFYEMMLRDAERAPQAVRWWYRLMAWVYYRAVRSFGAKCFFYGDRERTREDLDAEMSGG